MACPFRETNRRWISSSAFRPGAPRHCRWDSYQHPKCSSPGTRSSRPCCRQFPMRIRERWSDSCREPCCCSHPSIGWKPRRPNLNPFQFLVHLRNWRGPKVLHQKRQRDRSASWMFPHFLVPARAPVTVNAEVRPAFLSLHADSIFYQDFTKANRRKFPERLGNEVVISRDNSFRRKP
jgi:hypothetical protein